MDALIAQALVDAAPEIAIFELDYAETFPAPDPVSLELRRVIGAQVAQPLGMTPSVVPRWLSPGYHVHGMDALRRIADVLEMDAEVKLVPRRPA